LHKYYLTRTNYHDNYCLRSLRNVAYDRFRSERLRLAVGSGGYPHAGILRADIRLRRIERRGDRFLGRLPIFQQDFLSRPIQKRGSPERVLIHPSPHPNLRVVRRQNTIGRFPLQRIRRKEEPMTEQASRTTSSPRRKLLRLDSFWAWAVAAALLCGATVAVSLGALPSIKPAFLIHGSAEFYRLVDAGNAAQNKGDHSAAVEYYTKALSHRAPTVLLESIALRLRAESLRELGRLSEAIQDSDRAVTLTPNDPLAYFGRADVLLGLKRHTEALQDYDRYLARAPNDASAYLGKGAALRGLGKLAEAREAYDQAVKIAPNYANAYFGRGNVLNALGQCTNKGSTRWDLFCSVA
jgi:tetratricopeptide (TPR) repeat protein